VQALQQIPGKHAADCHGRLHQTARLFRQKEAMRITIFVVGIFLFVAADLTVNNGASFGGWLYYLATWMRSSGVL
jgi:hypothetical protein